MRPPSVEEACDLFARSAARFSAQLRGAGDGSTRIPHLEWTVGEMGAHLAHGFGFYSELFAGGAHPWPDVASGGKVNAELIASVPERDPAVLATMLDGAAERLVRVMRAQGAAEVNFIGGIRIPGASLAAIAAGECLVHGWDVAKALGRPWEISTPDALVVARGAVPFMPMLVDPVAAAGFTGTFVVRLRNGPLVTLAFADGVLTVSEGNAVADCRVYADPTAFLLSAYGRLGLWGPALRGQMIAYGLKPWLALKMQRLLVSP